MGQSLKILLPILTFCLITCSCLNPKYESCNFPEVIKLRQENDSLKALLLKNKEQMKLEINMIVFDAKAAADYYKRILNAEIISQTDNNLGMNETMMKLGGVEFRVLDENKELGMFAPEQVGAIALGVNMFVDDIELFLDNAIKEGCKVISPLQEFPDIPAKNAVFADKFNHIWVVNQQY
ncbi:VOC family protein [Prolixibacteraceae bacterium]|nr:VOC family protein [Prolixibacteraceae bacterium]